MGKYVLLIWGDPQQWASMSPEEQASEFKLYNDYSEWLQAQGWMLGGDPLTPPPTAKQVRVRDGQVLTTDGPFAETKEQLGGYYLIQCDTEDQALEAAAKLPAARGGVIEVWPVMELPSA
jgi:hypothetical protein